MFLAAAAKGMPPLPSVIPEYAGTVEVSRYRVVVEVALHNRLEPLAGLTHGIVCMRSRICCLMSRSFARMRLRIVLRLTVEPP